MSEQVGPAPGTMARYVVDGRAVCVANVDGRLYAIDDTCPHRQGSLSAGRLDETIVTCPRHGWRFDVATGACVEGERTSTRRHDVQLVAGELVVTLRPHRWNARAAPLLRRVAVWLRRR